LFAALICVSHTSAARESDRWGRCRGADPNARIAGCTEIIARGNRETKRNRIEAYINRSGAYQTTGNLDRAVADLDGAIAELSNVLRRDPKSIRALIERGTIHRQKGDLDRALADLDRALQLDSKSARALVERGAIYRERGDIDRAIADYTAAISAQPKSAQAFYGRAEAYLAKGDFDRAIADYGKALRLDKNLVVAYEGRAKAYRGHGELDRALADFSEAIKRNPTSASLHLDRAAIYEAHGNFDQAIADYDQAIERDPKLAIAHNNRGIVLLANGNLSKALADFSAAIEIDPRFADAFLNRANAYRRNGDLEHARRDLEAVLQLKPNLVAARDALDLLTRPGAETTPPSPSAGGSAKSPPPLTGHWAGLTALAIFAVAYVLVMMEEVIHLRKSKPVVFAAGLLWILTAFVYASRGFSQEVENSLRHVLLEYAELLLFLLVAMTYVNTLEERRVFDVLRAWLVRSGFSYRKLFWMTGVIAFFMSPIADNLTTALVMGAGANAPRFVALSCVNVVVAANAGGAFSPFGDITTLMVWQKGTVAFGEFFRLFLPSVVNFLVPAALMHAAVPRGAPEAKQELIRVKRGGRRILVLFLATVATAIGVHIFLHLPPVLGMMTGLGYFLLFGHYLQHTNRFTETSDDFDLDVFRGIERVEWDTLLFFYGVMMCVGALGVLGYLSLLSYLLYGQLGATSANILIGVLSAILDNIPLMFSVLTMEPNMSLGQWLLITLTTGVGGSMLSIGSAAGVALMGQARGIYTFFSHLRWTPAVALGYVASVLAHIALNGDIF
jgi:Na+/H+ antiporter NhaD/arsenite permease-like protein/Tfp pilus assembly protein PilF